MVLSCTFKILFIWFFQRIFGVRDQMWWTLRTLWQLWFWHAWPERCFFPITYHHWDSGRVSPPKNAFCCVLYTCDMTRWPWLSIGSHLIFGRRSCIYLNRHIAWYIHIYSYGIDMCIYIWIHLVIFIRTVLAGASCAPFKVRVPLLATSALDRLEK